MSDKLCDLCGHDEDWHKRSAKRHDFKPSVLSGTQDEREKVERTCPVADSKPTTCTKHGGVNQYCSICLAECAEKIAKAARCRNPNHALTDGSPHPHEIGLSCMAADSKPDADELLKAIYTFRETAGRHEGEHRSTLETCGKCNEAYVFAEAELYRHLKGTKYE